MATQKLQPYDLKENQEYSLTIGNLFIIRIDIDGYGIGCDRVVSRLGNSNEYSDTRDEIVLFISEHSK
jgi:hypothetical protein